MRNVIGDLIDKKIKLGTFIKIYNPRNNNWFIVKLLGYLDMGRRCVGIKGKWYATNMNEYIKMCNENKITEINIGYYHLDNDYLFEVTNDEVFVEVL